MFTTVVKPTTVFLHLLHLMPITVILCLKHTSVLRLKPTTVVLLPKPTTVVLHLKLNAYHCQSSPLGLNPTTIVLHLSQLISFPIWRSPLPFSIWCTPLLFSIWSPSLSLSEAHHYCLFEVHHCLRFTTFVLDVKPTSVVCICSPPTVILCLKLTPHHCRSPFETNHCCFHLKLTTFIICVNLTTVAFHLKPATIIFQRCTTISIEAHCYVYDILKSLVVGRTGQQKTQDVLVCGPHRL